MSVQISDRATVDPRAQIAEGVVVGPYCVIGPDVAIGENTILDNNVTVVGRVTIGKNNRFHAGAVIGGEPQDVSYCGGDTAVEIGDRNVIRECVTISRASEKEDGVTRIGNDNFFMACSHIAHDCRIGDHVTIANNTLLAGHVHIRDFASLSGQVAVHQFVTIEAYSFVAGCSAVRHDVPPYMLVEGFPARPRCVNIVGLKRHDFPSQVIQALAEAHKLLFRAKVGLDNAWEILRNNGSLVPQVNHLLNFVQGQHEGLHGRSREHRAAA